MLSGDSNFKAIIDDMIFGGPDDSAKITSFMPLDGRYKQVLEKIAKTAPIKSPSQVFKLSIPESSNQILKS
jgi:hypothetical protein